MANMDTGEMLDFNEIQKKPKEEQKKFKPVPPEFIQQMESMNRQQRRKFIKENKKEFEKYEKSLLTEKGE